MADTIRIKRRAAGGSAGAPTSLAAAEIAYNEVDDTLYYGWGNSSGIATVVKPIAGPGAFQPKDADLTALAALTVTNAIVYRSAADTWAQVTIGTGLAFSGGNLTATGGGSTPTYSFQTYLTAGTPTYTTPSDSTTATVYRIRMVAAGGSGAGVAAAATSGGGGGGSGEYKELIVTGLAPSTAISMTVGANGAAGGVSQATAPSGAATSVTIGGQAIVCNPGAGGQNGSQGGIVNGGNGGTGGATPAITGVTLITAIAGGGGLMGSGSAGGAGASTPLGNGGVGKITGAGVAGTGNGAGGGGSYAVSTAGAAGAPGGVIIERIQG